jgi:hypothetical protein
MSLISRMSGLAVLFPVLLVLLLPGCGNPEDAFSEATRADSPASYEQFLADYPASAQAPAARSRLEILNAYQAAEVTATAAAWWAFRRSFPSFDRDELARDHYLDALTVEVLEALPDELSDRPSAEDARRLAERRTIGSGEDAPAAQAFLLAMVGAQPAEARVAPPGLTTISPLQVREDAGAIVAAVAGIVFATLDSGTSLSVKGRDLLQDDSTDLLVLTADGPLSVEFPGAWLTGVVGRTTVSERDERGAWLRADTPGEEVLLASEWLGATRPVLPAAPGSVIRVVGQVAGLAAGWIFEGQEDDPLVFAFFEDGPAYIGGTGRIVATDGQEILFPAAASAGPPIHSSAITEGESDVLPALHITPAPRILTLDDENTLLWMRDPATTDAFPVIRLDLNRSTEHEGQKWIGVDRNQEVLADLENEGDILVREGETFVSVGSLSCDDSWVRIWNLEEGHSWYRRRTATEILTRRLLKYDGDRFVRNVRHEEWAGPDANHEGVGGQVKIIVDKESGEFMSNGGTVFAFGKTLIPAIPLLQLLANKDAAEIESMLRRLAPSVAGEPLEAEEIVVLAELRKEIPGLKELAARTDLTLGSLRAGLAEYPQFLAVLTDRSVNKLQALAVMMDERAGTKIMSHGVNAPSDLFLSTGATYTFDLPSEAPYPIGPDLRIWAGTVRVVKDIDGQPLKWVDDGTQFKLRISRILRSSENQAGGGKLDLVALGVFADGYPREVVGLLREAAYLSGPIEREKILFNGVGESDTDTGNRRLEFSRFGEVLRLPAD